MKKLLIVSIILAVMGLGVNGFAYMGGAACHGMQNGAYNGHRMQNGAYNGHRMQNGAYKNMPWFAALTPEKQAEVQKIIDNNIKDITALKLKMDEKQAKLDTMMFDNKTPQKNIDKVVSEINAIRSKLYQKNINMRIGLKKAGVPYPY